MKVTCYVISVTEHLNVKIKNMHLILWAIRSHGKRLKSQGDVIKIVLKKD